MEKTITNENKSIKVRKPNPWCAFVKANSKGLEKLTKQERIRVLSEMWKSEKSNIITISTNYIEKLRDDNTKSKMKLQEAEMRIQQLTERILYLESTLIDSYNTSCNVSNDETALYEDFNNLTL